MTNDSVIQGAAKAIWEESTDPGRKGRWEDEPEYAADEYANQARAAFAVFEKAHTPTDDEREALWDAFDEMHRITEGGCGTRGEDVADMAIALGFRRTPQGEPTIADNFLSTAQARGLSPEKRRAGMDQLTGAGARMDQAQGEPTDAQVIAALNAYQDRRRLGTTLGDWGSVKVQQMRAALRAAAAMRGEGKP